MKLSKELLNNLIEITSNSAIACYPYIGKNEKKKIILLLEFSF